MYKGRARDTDPSLESRIRIRLFSCRSYPDPGQLHPDPPSALIYPNNISIILTFILKEES